MPLIEDMAKAITRGPHSVWPWQDYVPGAQRALAVVFASLREPSEDVQHAGLKALSEGGLGDCDCHQLEVWQAMLNQWAKEQGVE